MRDSQIFWKKSAYGKNCQKWPKNIVFGLFKGNPNFQGILNWILQIFLYHCNKQYKNIENLQFIEQNIVIFFCLLRLLLPSPFSIADVFQFLDTVLSEILNVTSDHSCRCMKSHAYNTFNLRYFVSSIRESSYKSHSSSNINLNFL